MKTIVIMRHSKADKTGNYTDFERPLTQQGIKDAKSVAKKLAKMNFSPQKVFVSSALRTTQTAQIISKKLYFDEPLTFCDDFYNGNIDNYFTAILSANNDFKNILLIGHNPTCEDIVYELTGKSIELKTSSSVVMKFETNDWTNCLKMKPKEFFLIEK